MLRLRQKLLLPLLLSIAAGVIIYIVSIIASGYSETVGAVSRLDGWAWLLILSLSVCNYGLRFLRWQWYLRLFGHTIPLIKNFSYYLAAFAFTTTPGKAGEAVRSLYLKSHAVKYTQSLAAFFTERFMDLMAIAILAIRAALQFRDYQWVVVVVAVIILVSLQLIRAPWLRNLLHKRRQRIESSKLKTVIQRIISLLESSALLFKQRILYGGFIIGVLAWGAEGIAFYYILWFLGIETSPTIAIGIYAISTLVGALSFILH